MSFPREDFGKDHVPFVRPTEAFNGAAPEASVASSESNGGAECYNRLFNRISPCRIGGEARRMVTPP